MKNPTVYDVLVVYTDGIATSASSTKLADIMPFSKRSKRLSYNDSYAYFLDVCRKNNLKAAFTTSKDLSENGNFNTHWTFERNKWKKIASPCYSSLVFDKFSPINKKQKNRRALLFSNVDIMPFNSNEILLLFFDKQRTYDMLNKFTIPTVALKNRKNKSVNDAISALQEIIDLHPQKNDFSKKIVIKDRYGAGGNNIYCTELTNRKAHIRKVAGDNKSVSFILQPFAEFKDGYKSKENLGFTDIRIIYLGKKIIQSYIRIASKDDFRCNTHQGGSIEYIPARKIPLKIRKMGNEILHIMNDRDSLFALDFIISNNGNAYLMEGNSGPGLNWSLTLNKDEKYTKKLIREIVKVIGGRIQEARIGKTVLNKSYMSLASDKSSQISI